MIVYTPHLRAVRDALACSEPLLLLPSLHPDYLRSLLTQWSEQASTEVGDTASACVVLFEPGCGASKLGDGVLKPSGPHRDLREWLQSKIDGVPRRAEHAAAGRPVANTLHWLAGTDRLLDDELVQTAIAALCRRIATYDLPWRILLEDPGRALPRQLTSWTRAVELKAPRPNADEDGDFARRVMASRAPELTQALDVDDDDKERLPRLLRQVQGLDAASINLVFSEAVRSMPAGSMEQREAHVIQRVGRERDRLLKRASGLVLERVGNEELLGMNRLQRHLEYVDVLLADFADADKAQDGPRPRGVLLAGLPGCGKSLAARIAAKKLQVPLLRLDVGAMMGRYLGESESNLQRALDAAEASAPCVLWVDEIEKALGGLDGNNEGGGTGGRILAQLLGWMQDHQSQVYLFATANAVAQLPPALLRRGRFDELWRVTLPTTAERLAILQSKLRPVGDTLAKELRESADSTALKNFVKTSSKGFTGADLESLVKEAWSRARVQDEELSIASMKKVLDDGFEPMSAQFKDKIDASIKELDDHGFRDVSCDEGKLPPPVPDARRAGRGELVGLLNDFWNSRKGTMWRIPEHNLLLRHVSAQPDADRQRSLDCERADSRDLLGLAKLTPRGSSLRLTMPGAQRETILSWKDGSDAQVLWDKEPVHLATTGARRLANGSFASPNLPSLGDTLLFAYQSALCALRVGRAYLSIARLRPPDKSDNIFCDDTVRSYVEQWDELSHTLPPAEQSELYITDWYAYRYDSQHDWALMSARFSGTMLPRSIIIRHDPETSRLTVQCGSRASDRLYARIAPRSSGTAPDMDAKSCLDALKSARYQSLIQAWQRNGKELDSIVSHWGIKHTSDVYQIDRQFLSYVCKRELQASLDQWEQA